MDKNLRFIILCSPRNLIFFILKNKAFIALRNKINHQYSFYKLCQDRLRENKNAFQCPHEKENFSFTDKRKKKKFQCHAMRKTHKNPSKFMFILTFHYCLCSALLFSQQCSNFSS